MDLAQDNGLLDEMLDEARYTIAHVEPDLPDPLSETAEDVHYTMALVTASLPTAQEAADRLAEAFRSLGTSVKTL